MLALRKLNAILTLKKLNELQITVVSNEHTPALHEAWAAVRLETPIFSLMISASEMINIP